VDQKNKLKYHYPILKFSDKFADIKKIQLLTRIYW